MDRQPGSTDDKDEVNSTDTDDDADYMISSVEEAENEEPDRHADDNVPIVIPRLSTLVTI